MTRDWCTQNIPFQNLVKLNQTVITIPIWFTLSRFRNVFICVCRVNCSNVFVRLYARLENLQRSDSCLSVLWEPNWRSPEILCTSHHYLSRGISEVLNCTPTISMKLFIIWVRRIPILNSLRNVEKKTRVSVTDVHVGLPINMSLSRVWGLLVVT